jgi:hypothetical protein
MARIDTPAGQPEEDGLRDIFRVRDATGYAVSSLKDKGLVRSKNFFKLWHRLHHHDVFYRGRQASLLGSSTT